MLDGEATALPSVVCTSQKTDRDRRRGGLMRVLTAEHYLQPAIAVRATLITIGVLVTVLAGAGCKSSKCFPDCVAGYEPVPNACTCRPIADAGADGNLSDVADGSTSSDGASDAGPPSSCVPPDPAPPAQLIVRDAANGSSVARERERTLLCLDFGRDMS